MGRNAEIGSAGGARRRGRGEGHGHRGNSGSRQSAAQAVTEPAHVRTPAPAAGRCRTEDAEVVVELVERRAIVVVEAAAVGPVIAYDEVPLEVVPRG
eukprot:scaffold5021_cov123-Isochrysis_galbana.AAC.14